MWAVTHCVRWWGPGSTVKGFPWPWDATWDLGAWLSLY